VCVGGGGRGQADCPLFKLQVNFQAKHHNNPLKRTMRGGVGVVGVFIAQTATLMKIP
jgi:hypothetical protein